MSEDPELLDGETFGGWKRALLPAWLQDHLAPFTAEVRARRLSALLVSLRAAQPEIAPAKTEDRAEGLGEADLALIARVNHSVADGLRKHGYFYGTLTSDFLKRLIALAQHDQARPGVELPHDWSEYEDDIADAISDSMDMDWTSRDGARAVVRFLNKWEGK